MSTTSPLVLTDYTGINDVLTQIVRWCLREGIPCRSFTPTDMRCINAHGKDLDGMVLTSGFISFNARRDRGMFRLCSDTCDPKWNFQVKGEKVLVDMA